MINEYLIILQTFVKHYCVLSFSGHENRFVMCIVSTWTGRAQCTEMQLKHGNTWFFPSEITSEVKLFQCDGMLNIVHNYYFQTGSHYVVQAGLKLAILPASAS
jgi:hypothetical protein